MECTASRRWYQIQDSMRLSLICIWLWNRLKCVFFFLSFKSDRTAHTHYIFTVTIYFCYEKKKEFFFQSSSHKTTGNWPFSVAIQENVTVDTKRLFLYSFCERIKREKVKNFGAKMKTIPTNTRNSITFDAHASNSHMYINLAVVFFEKRF